MDKYQSCAFTGHRPHKFPWRYNEADERCMALKAALKGRLLYTSFENSLVLQKKKI